MVWVLIILSLSGGVHYETFGYGPSEERRCKAAASAITEQTQGQIRGYCVGWTFAK